MNAHPHHLTGWVMGLSLVVGIVLAVPAHAAVPGVKELPSAEQLPAIKELPDPFVMNDGSRVKTQADWAKRREELKAAILYYEYGHLPPAGDAVAGSDEESTQNAEIGATQKKIALHMGPQGKLTVHLELMLPPGKGPFPVVIRGDLGWGKLKPEILKMAAARGYAIAEFDRTEVVPDSKQRTGLYLLYPDYDFAALSAWAWGYHRVIDYLVTRPEIDKAKIVISGHSRGGKCVLLAGALDERIAITIPNNSGCGGAGCYRFQAGKSEDIAAITKNFPFWFSTRFPAFIGKVDRLPFDQHSLKALVAPRALLTTEALGDQWANPEGTQQTYLAAKQVYDFLGAGSKIGITFRPGGHEHGPYDWTTVVDFADMQFFGKPSVDRKFDQLAFPDSPKAFTWTTSK